MQFADYLTLLCRRRRYSEKNGPYYAHFGDVERSYLFEDATREVFREYTGDIPNDAFDYLAGEPTGSTLEKQAAAIKELNAYVSTLFHELKAGPGEPFADQD